MTESAPPQSGGLPLDQAKQSFDSLFCNSPEPMVVSSVSDATIMFANPAFFKLLGDGSCAVIGQKSSTIYRNPADRVRFIEAISQHGYSREFATQFIGADGIIDVLLSASPVTLNGEECLITIARDVTRAKQAEEMLQRNSKWLALLQAITALANQGSCSNQTLTAALGVFCESLSFAAGHIYQLDEARNSLQSSGIWHVQPEKDFSSLKQITMQTSYSTSFGPGVVLQTKAPLIVPLFDQKSPTERRQSLLNYGFNWATVLPVCLGNDVVAIIELFSDQRVELDPYSLDMLAQAAAQLSRVFEREAANHAISEQQARLQGLIKDLDVYIWEMSMADNSMRFVSDSVEHVLGFTAKECRVPGFCSSHIHPDDLALVSEQIALASTQASLDYRYRFRDAQGQYRWLNDIVHVEYDEQGAPVLLRGVSHDCSDRIEEQQALEMSERRFELLFNDTPAIFFSLDESGIITSVNRFGAQHLGYEVAQLAGQNFLDLIVEEDHRITRQKMLSCMSNPGEVSRWQIRHLHRQGDTIWARLSGRVVQGSTGQSELIVVGEDINETQRLSQQLQHQATHDALTGLINRKEFERQINQLLESTDQQTSHALCYLDLDQFKVINDACGHLAGDELLRQLTEKISSRVRSSDTIARLGGDEFGILMRNCSIEQGDQVAEQIRELVDNFKFVWEKKRFRIGVSIGLVPINNHTGTLQELLSAADVACYAAKDAGRNRVHIYHPDDFELNQRRNEMDWVRKINEAIEEDRLVLYMQPIMDLKNTRRRGEHYELLIRMIDKDGSIIPPGAFLPAAERFDLALQLDLWVINTVFDWFDANQRHVLGLAQCNINLSGQSLAKEQLLDVILERLSSSQVPPEKLCFEITETAAIHNLAIASGFMRTLKDRGCLFALDDFGSGLSSFSYLKQFPVDILKIDGSFVREMVNDPIDYAMVQSIHDIGHVMGKRTVAEFVEDDATIRALREIGIDYAQGFGVGKPIPFIMPHNIDRKAS